MVLGIVFLISLAVFLAVDAVWLRRVAGPIFEARIGSIMRSRFRVEAAFGFYILYVAGILYFCTLPGLADGSAAVAFLNGLTLGFLAYGTYEFTNMATLRGWTWHMVLLDTGWGALLTGVTAAAGVVVGERMGL